MRRVYPAASAQRSVVSRRLTLSVMAGTLAQNFAYGAARVVPMSGRDAPLPDEPVAKRVRIPEDFRLKYDRIAGFTGRKPCHHAAEWPI
jgi:hypothetical protein